MNLVNTLQDINLAVNAHGSGDMVRLPIVHVRHILHHYEHLIEASRTAFAEQRPVARPPFQVRMRAWLVECFGAKTADDCNERNHRFLEEALELVQACGCTRSEALQLVDYVYNRPVGERFQEVGGVMTTLSGLCSAHDIDMAHAGETELERIWTKVPEIRAKQAAKPKNSPLPMEAKRVTWREPMDLRGGEPIGY